MSFVTRKFSTARTRILWDVDSCPIPKRASPVSVSAKIKSALKDLGYNGEVSIIAYSLKKVNKIDFESAAIELIQFEGHGRGKRERMFTDVYMWQLGHRQEPKNLLVITENIEDNDFVGALLHLRNLDNNILLALPQSPSLLLKHLASHVWLWTSLLTGGSPVDDGRLSARAQLFYTSVTGVLWDLEYCPIPEGASPASVSANIKSALKEAGYTGEVSITAYSIENLDEQDFESAAIKLKQLGDTRAKRSRMFDDIYNWGREHRNQLKNLMVITKAISERDNFVIRLGNVKVQQTNILLAQPQGNAPQGIASSVWLWSSLSTGGSPLGNPTGSSKVISLPTTPSSSGSSLHVKSKKKMKRRLLGNPSGSSKVITLPTPSLHVDSQKKMKRLHKKVKRTRSEDQSRH